jgi:Hexameric tyrosine-coordinated heme protein (HTHP)
MSAAEPWLPSLAAPTPQAGFDLAVKLARMAVKATQSSDEVRTKLRAAYEQDTAQLIAASGVVATHFATVAAANGYWRKPAS